jgi:ParB family chromosome partitioning protein
MMTDPRDIKRRGLGRGLSALLPSAAPPSPIRSSEKSKAYFAAGIEELYPSPEQPRRKFDETQLAELADSIKMHGVIAPLVVRPRPPGEGGGYFLIAGERRWRAAQRAGLHEVPVVVQEVDTKAAFERALVDNLQRADLGALEEATAFQRLIDEFGLTQEQVADRIGKDRSTVANAIRLLKLPVARQLARAAAVDGRALLLEQPPASAALPRVLSRALSVRDRGAGQEDANPHGPPRIWAKGGGDLEERPTRARGPVKIIERAGQGHIGSVSDLDT